MFGWFGGRGWGATLGYCPWTGLPRGWRWYGYPYGQYYQPWIYGRQENPYLGYGQYYQPWPYSQQPGTYGQYDEKEALENEYKYLQERLEEVKRRLDQLKK